jgi:hypothetical protein
MLFFLSKFLPAFIYPLGIIWLLMLVSLMAQLRKSSRIGIAANIAALAILWLMGNRAVSHMLLGHWRPATSPRRRFRRSTPLWSLAE